MLTPEDEARLADLRWHWGEAYTIDCRDGAWTAQPVADRAMLLSACSEHELRLAIRSDYDSRDARILGDGALHRSEACRTVVVTICRCRQGSNSGSLAGTVIRE